MAGFIEIAKDYATVINSFVIAVLLFKYLFDIRKQRLEHQKLELEVKRLREAEDRKKLEVIKPTRDDIREFVIDPMLKEIREAYEEQHKLQRRFLGDFHNSLISFSEQRRDDSSLLADAFRQLIHAIERNLEAVSKLESTLRRQIEEK